MRNNVVFYILTLLIFGTALWSIIGQGKKLETEKFQTKIVVESPLSDSQEIHFFSNLTRNVLHPLSIFILQIFCIMLAARMFGVGMTKIGQPAVVGEIVAGIVLGPSLVGSLFPEFFAFLFPESSLSKLLVLSQMGLFLFMFIIGMELDTYVLKKKAHAAVIVSHVSIILPYFLGVALAYFLYPSYAPENISFTAFALFMGIAMSVTAFPVLARILQERNLTQTSIGSLIITCAAADDITAWCLLALVVAIVSAGGMISAVGSIVLSFVYLFFMFFVVKPILHRVAVKYDTPESINKTIVAVIFGMLLLSCYITEVIGIHALFGAFLAGVIMPPQKEFKRILSEKIEDVSLVLLLPLFFVFTGLRTQIGLLYQSQLWGVCFLIIGVAVLGKFVGSAAAAKFVGQSWKDSLLIGVLMNTRGLMELVVLNIGYELGILSPEIFTMMVLMALVTTFMAGPAIGAIEFFFKEDRQREVREITEGFQVLLSFGFPKSGSRLLELAYALNLKYEKDDTITAVHFSPSADISILEAEQHERESFLPIQQTAERLGIPLKKIFKVTDHVEKEIIQTVKRRRYDIVLVGSSRELFTDEKTGRKMRSLIQQMDSGVGVFIDRGFKEIDDMLIVLKGFHDLFLLKYAKKFLAGNQKKRLRIFDPENAFATKEELQKLSGMELKGNFSLAGKHLGEKKDFYQGYDLVITSLSFWESLKVKQDDWLELTPSVLIINR
jgi:Kef-type K+ transport system membrane component KefB